MKPTVFKAHLHVADIDHNHYAEYKLTLARHPSETDERMMLRLAAYAWQAHELQDRCGGDGFLNFGEAICQPDEPDLQLVDFTEAVRLWVQVGQPSDKALSKACARAERVVVYAYDHAAEVWWQGIAGKVHRLGKLEVNAVPAAQSQALAALAERSMQLQATVQDGILSLSSNLGMVDLEPQRWQEAKA